MTTSGTRGIARALAVIPWIVAGGGCAGGDILVIPPASELPILEAQVAGRPSDVGVALRLGAGYRAAGRLDEARKVLESAHATDGTHDALALFLGLTYEDLDRPRDARQVYHAYLETGEAGVLRDEIEARVAVVRRKELRAALAASLDDEVRLASAVPDPYSVAVFPFVYQGSDERLLPLGRAFAAMLVTDLAKTDRLTVLERTDVDMLLAEADLSASERVDPLTAVRGGRLLGAAHVVQGLMSGDASRLTLDGVVVELDVGPAGGRALQDEAWVEEVFDMEKRVAFSIYESLGIELTVAERERVSRRPTENIRALLAFGHGLEAEALGAVDDARRHFRESISLDPGFEDARAAADRVEREQIPASNTDAVAQRATARLRDLVDESIAGLDGFVPTDDGRDPLEEIGAVGPAAERLRITIRRPGGD